MDKKLSERMKGAMVPPSVAALWEEATLTLEAIDEVCEKAMQTEYQGEISDIQKLTREGVRR